MRDPARTKESKCAEYCAILCLAITPSVSHSVAGRCRSVRRRARRSVDLPEEEDIRGNPVSDKMEKHAAFVSAIPASLGTSSFVRCGAVSARGQTAGLPQAKRVTRCTPVRPVTTQSPTMSFDFGAMLKKGSNFALVAALAGLLSISSVDQALAASGGGRVGGSSFRSPAQTYSAPPGAVSPGYGYGGGYGGGFFGPGIMFAPVIAPIGGFGGLGTILLAGTAAAFLYRSVQERNAEAEFAEAVNPRTAVVTLKVGLLSTARALQLDFDMVARSADTSSVRGLRYVLEEAILALMRNPDYWTHGSVSIQEAQLDAAEDLFNQRCMEERLKIGEETLTNVGGSRREAERANATQADMSVAPSEYIVVSIVGAAAGNIAERLPSEIKSPEDLKNALGILGAVSVDDLQGVEVIWAPQSLKDTLTLREMLADHPELRQL